MHAEDVTLTHYLNVDFDIECGHDLGELVAALAPSTIVLGETETSASFELDVESDDVQSCLDAFIRAVEGLTPDARRVWNECNRRTANIGIQAGRRPSSFAFPISQQTIAALAAIGCGVEFTVYAPASVSDEASGEAWS